MKRFFATLLCVFAVSAIAALAQNVEQVYTKDGNIYYGYISRQPTTGSVFQFVKERQLVTLSNESSGSASVEYSNVKFTSLSQAIQEYLVSEQGITDGTVKIAKIIADGKTYYKTFVLNDGYPLTFMWFDRALINIPYSNLQKIARNPRGSEEKSGVVTSVDLKGGYQYVGQVIEQYLGKSLSLLSEDNAIYSVDYADIAAIRYDGLDKSKPLFDQVPLLDQIVMSDGTRFVGFITSRDLVGGKITILEQRTNVSRMLESDKVQYFEKLPNIITVKDEPKDEKPAPAVLIDTMAREFNKFTVITENKTVKKKKVTFERFVVMTPLAEITTVNSKTGDVHFDFLSFPKVRTSHITICHAREYEATESKWGQTTKVLYPAVYSEDPVADVEYDFDKEKDRTIIDVTFPQSGLYVICFKGHDECIAVNVTVRGTSVWKASVEEDAEGESTAK